MVSVRLATSPNALLAGVGIVILSVLLAFVTNIAVMQLSPVKVAFALGGFALLIPTLVLRDPKAYWLFLLVFTIPFDISKLLSAGLVDPGTLVQAYGQPASGTTAVELYLTDVVLIAMLLPWLAQVCLRQQSLYFPKIGYFFVFYLAWSLLVSLINAQSYYLAIFELCRQSLYLLFFVYLINNIGTRLQLRSAVLAVFLGFAVSASTVIAFFEMGIGTETSIFAQLHDISMTTSQGAAYKPGSNITSNENLTVHGVEHRFGPANRGQEGAIKRSQGMFRHPAIAANLCGLTLPIVLAYVITAPSNRRRILLSMLFLVGIVALVLTFSRGGALGFAAGIIVFFAVGKWSGLISRRVFAVAAVALAAIVAVSIPLLVTYFGSRPGTFLMRFDLFEAALNGYAQHPILGVGLNNSTAAMKAGRQALIEIGIPMPPTESADSFYLVALTEVGPLGCMLLLMFFGNAVVIGLRAMQRVAADQKPLLVGVLAGLAALMTQNIADDTLGAHAISAMLWLLIGLIIAVARNAQANVGSSIAGRLAAPVPG